MPSKHIKANNCQRCNDVIFGAHNRKYCDDCRIVMNKEQAGKRYAKFLSLNDGKRPAKKRVIPERVRLLNLILAKPFRTEVENNAHR